MGAMASKILVFFVSYFYKIPGLGFEFNIPQGGLVIMFLPMMRMLMMFVAIMMMNSRTILIMSKAASVVGISI